MKKLIWWPRKSFSRRHQQKFPNQYVVCQHFSIRTWNSSSCWSLLWHSVLFYLICSYILFCSYLICSLIFFSVLFSWSALTFCSVLFSWSALTFCSDLAWWRSKSLRQDFPWCPFTGTHQNWPTSVDACKTWLGVRAKKKVTRSQNSLEKKEYMYCTCTWSYMSCTVGQICGVPLWGAL